MYHLLFIVTYLRQEAILSQDCSAFGAEQHQHQHLEHPRRGHSELVQEVFQTKNN